MPRKNACAPALQFASTAELLGEIERRSLGCMLICVRVEERGDTWRYAIKGSPIFLGAMSAALNVKLNEKLAGQQQPL